MRILAYIATAILVFQLGDANAQQEKGNNAQPDPNYNIELVDGRSMYGREPMRSTHDELLITAPNGVRLTIPGRNVGPITTLSTPLEPSQPLDWSAILLQPDPPPPPCECCNDNSTFAEAHLGGTWRGKASYIKQTPAGGTPIQTESFGFGAAGTTIGLQGDLSYGWHSGSFHYGGLIGVVPSDGAVFLPVGVHVAYETGSNILGFCASVFGNAALPIDFQTHAPLFYKDFSRQRKFLAGGLELIAGNSMGTRYSIQIGVEHLAVPLERIDCCPGLPEEDHYPTRALTSGLFAIGLSF